MKNYILLLLFFTCMSFSFSQETSNVKCGFFGNKTIKQRNATYPFNKSKKLLLISYLNEEKIEETGYLTRKTTILNDSITFSNSGYKILREFSFKTNEKLRNKLYDATKIVELDQDDIDTLSNLMFNYDIRKIDKTKKNEAFFSIKCYTPRHAIIFLNEQNKIVSILEISFECLQFYLFPSSKKVGKTIGYSCDNSLEYLKELYTKNGFTVERI